MAQIKYDPISRCKPRNNGIDFISISTELRTITAEGSAGSVDFEGRPSGEKADEAVTQRRRRARIRPEGPGACKGDANARPKGTYRATNVGRSACTSRKDGVARRGETRETEQRRRRRPYRWDEEKRRRTGGWEWIECRWIEKAPGVAARAYPTVLRTLA